MVKLTYPERVAPKGSKVKYPQVEVIWYDGGLQPPKPAGWPAGKNMNNGGGGVYFSMARKILLYAVAMAEIHGYYQVVFL